jgi:cysteine desulfurase
MEQIEAHFRKMRDRLHNGLQEALGEERVKLNGHPQRRLPNTLNLSFRDTAANLILAKIGPHVAASAGAACHADRVEISAVLQAMGLPEEWAKGAIRFSVGRETTVGQIETAVAVVAEAVQQLKTIKPLTRSKATCV